MASSQDTGNGVPQDTGRCALLDRLAGEILERWQRGEAPSVQEYVDRYPDLADALRDLFPALVGAQAATPVPPAAAPPPDAPRISGYRILRRVGRGGMGVVYEAEQESLGRRVALKVLSASAADNAGARERFRREARATAKLHHTHIVPVFEVGQDGDVCYYAMQLVQGQGLDQVIDELRRLRAASRPAGRPSPPGPPRPGGEVTPRVGPQTRAVARSLLAGVFRPQLTEGDAGPAPGEVTESTFSAPQATPPPPGPAANGPPSAVLPGPVELSAAEAGRGRFFRAAAHVAYQAATALAYAHARGVIHRDVKPSNLLLDVAGGVWVTDFGLAKTDDEALTRTGDLLGTFRYMAPERFQGACDARADVYALGLTLYELLTLRPAHDEVDRFRLMDQIKNREPPPPRSLAPDLPRDLETIVLTAGHKDPQRRYPSADDLAEDLRRFLADEPIRARRAGLPERAFRWCRRNPVVAGLTALLVVVLVTATAVSVVAAYRFDRLARDNARAAREAREAEAKEAEARLRSEQAGREAQAQRRRAEANFDHARSALDEYLVRVSGSEVLKAPGLQPLRRELLESALKFYQKFLREQGDAPELRVALVGAHVKLARIYRDLGLHAESRASGDEALALARVLARERPGDVEAQNALAEACRAAGDFQQAIALWKPLIDPKNPRFQRDLADCYNVLAVRAGSDNHLAESLRHHQEALALRRRLVELEDVPVSHRDLGSTLNNLGILLQRQNRMDEALAMYRDSLRHARPAWEQAPHDIVAGQFLVILLRNLGSRDRAVGDRDGAVRWYDEAADVARRLLVDNPAVPRLYEVSFNAHSVLADLHAERNDGAAAGQHVRKALEVAERQPRQGADNLYTLATMRAWCAEALGLPPAAPEAERRRQADLAVAVLREAVAAGYRDHRRAEGQAEFRPLAGRPDFEEVMARLRDAGRAAELSGQGGPLRERLERGRQALVLRDRLARQEPASPTHRADLAASHHSLGLLQLQAGRFDEAARALDEAGRLRDALAREEPGDPRHPEELAAVRIDRGRVEWQAGRLAQAVPFWQEALGTLQMLTRARPEDARVASRLAAAERAVGEAYASVGLWDEPLPYQTPAGAHEPPAGKRLPPDGRGDVGNARLPALSLYRAGHYPEALARLRESDLTHAATWPLLALIHYQLGDVEEARYWLRLAEQHGERACRSVLQGDSLILPGFSWPPSPGWSDWPPFLSLLGEARQRIRGAAGDDAWFHLVRGRALALLGRAAEADEEIRRAGQARPGDPLVPVTRGLIQARLGRHDQALQHLGRAVAAAGDDPRPWIARGRYYLERGADARADADLARAADLAKGELRPFLQAGWWVAGPYSEDLAQACPPEHDPHPSRPVAGEDGRPRPWRLAPTEAEGRLELGPLFGGAEHISAYALNYVYSPDDRAVTLYVGSDDTVRVWLNGRLIHEHPTGREAVPREDVVRASLRAGRNVLLVKVGNGIVEHRLYLSDGSSPFERGLALAEAGRWREAAALTGPALAAEPADHPLACAQDAVLQAAAGDEAAYRRAAARLMERYGRSPAPAAAVAVARACSLGPDAVPDAARLVALARREAPRDPRQSALVALAHYRAGQPSQAIQAIEQGRAGEWPVAWPVLALAYHRLGRPVEARRCLDRAGGWDDATGERPSRPWTDRAAFETLRREAQRVLKPAQDQAAGTAH